MTHTNEFPVCHTYDFWHAALSAHSENEHTFSKQFTSEFPGRLLEIYMKQWQLRLADMLMISTYTRMRVRVCVSL